MAKIGPLFIYILLLFCTPSLTSSSQRRQSRQAPRFPIIDAIFSTLQGRPFASQQGPPPPPQLQQTQQSFPQLEGGFSPIGSSDSLSSQTINGAVFPSSGTQQNLLQNRPPQSVADSVDLTVQSLGPFPQGGQRLRPDGPFVRQRVPPPFLNRGPPENIRQQTQQQFPGRLSPQAVDNNNLGLVRQVPPVRTIPQFPPSTNPLTFSPQQQQFSTLQEVPAPRAPFQRPPPPAFPAFAAPQPATFLRDAEPTPQTEATIRRATLLEVLKEDCPNFEERGFCESPGRYPTAQVALLMTRCSRILDALYVPVPETNVIPSSSSSSASRAKNKGSSLERANHAIWSWAKYSGKSSVCSAESRLASPSYARDMGGKWVVVLQSHEGNMTQRVPVEICEGGGDRPCLSGPDGESRLGTRCVQRQTHHHLVTWDPENPDDCPSLRVFSFPTACLCHFSADF